MFKRIHYLFSLCLMVTSLIVNAQTTFTWNSYPNAATSWTNGNLSIAFTGSGNYTDGAPKFGNPQGCAMGNGLYVAQDWSNATSFTTMTITFATAVGAPVTFSISDINSNYCNSSTPYECTFLDEVTLTGTTESGAGILPTVSGLCSGQTNTTAGNNRIIRADINTGGNGGCTCATTNFSVGTAGQCVKTITITYRNNQTSNAIWNNNPAYQYIILSSISTSAAPASTPPSSITGTTTICANASTTLTAVGGNASSQWYTGSCSGTLIGTGSSITVNPSTTTTYYVSNMSCGTPTSCAQTTVTVNPLPAAPVITSSGPTTFCTGGNVTLTSSSATGNTWSTGATTQSITVSAAGTYTVNYASGGCNSPNASATVTVNPLPSTPTVSASGPTTFCTGGSVTLTSSSATGNTWSTGATTQSITVSAAGTYTVNVTNGNGCVSANGSSTVTVNPLPSAPLIATGGPTTFCAGSSVTLTSSSATGNTWSTGATTQSITVSAAGTYSVSYVSGGCTSPSASATITVNPLPSTPTVSASGPTTFCTGGSVTLTSSSATGNTWSTGATTQSITVNSSGTYTVNVTDGNGCTSANGSSTVTVTPLPATPTVSAGGPLSFCSGNSVTLTSSSASGNTWSTGATTQSITVNSSGTYSVTVGSAGCSATSANTSVTVNPLPSAPTVSAGGPLSFCSGGSVTLTSSSASGNTWSTGATTPSITVSAAGTYTVSVTDGNGCTSTAESATVTVNPLPSAPLISASGPTTFCTGGSVTLTSSSATNNTWSTGETTQSIIVNSPGTYTVSYVDGNGCTSSTASTTVTILSNPPTPVVSAGGPLTFCSGGTVTLTSSSATGNTWSTGETTQSITVNSSGTYSVTVGASGCSSTSANTSVTVNPLPSTPIVATSGPTAFCTGGSVTLTSSAATGNTWSTGATTPSITVNTSGNYTVSVTDGNGCTSSTASTTITVNPLPATPTVSASGPLSFCQGGSVTLSSSSVSGNTWSTGETTQNIVVNAAGTYTVSVTDGNGCTSGTGSTTVIVNPNPGTPAVSLNGPATFCSGNSVVLTSSSTSGNAWSTGETTQSITVNSSGNYSVTVSDINGCSASSANTSITVNPTTATPNITDSGLNICAGQTTTLTSSSTTGNTWSTGETTQTITVNTAGTYTLTADDGSGCPSSPVSVVVTVTSNPATPTISANGPLTFCAGDSVTLTSSSTNGNTWSTGETTQSIVVSTSGNYTVTVGAAGCSAISAATTTLELPLPSTPLISNTGLVFCAGQSTTLTSNSTTGNNWSTGETTQSITVTSSGNYWLTFTDGNGCTSDSTTVTVTVNPLPASPLITANNPLSFCQGDSVNLTVSPGTGIVWTPGNTTDSTLTVNSSGVFTVTYTDANGCTSTSAPVSVTANTIPSAPSLSVSGGSNVICQGQSATLNANPSTGITWTPGGQTTSSISVSTAGTYYASYTDANGCTSPLDSITISVNPLPQIASTVNIDSAFCNTASGGINNLIVTGGTGTYSYQWFNGTTAVGTDSVLSNVSSGNYSLIVTDQAGCSDTSFVMSVPSAGGISVSLTANPTSGMEPFNTNVLATTSTTANSYTWFNNNTLLAGETDSIANLTGLTQGTYNTTVIVTDSYGCADTATITISVDGNIDIVIPNVFSPNGDNTNDVFFITAEGYKELHMEIYDRWGLKLWEVTGLNPSWDGRTTAGLEVTDGTYYYILRGVDFKNTTMEKTGYLSVVK
ncbi:MAG: gliding motility-associated C-terminal domain-containing protein [Bacteroidia bacterium]|nr:gliding motility-associated C-terminal domain-containing protein [Bacteroidia bacterium]